MQGKRHREAIDPLVVVPAYQVLYPATSQWSAQDIQRSPQQLQHSSTSSSMLQMRKVTQAVPQLIRTATIWSCHHLIPMMGTALVTTGREA
jgi:hypothetical protein